MKKEIVKLTYVEIQRGGNSSLLLSNIVLNELAKDTVVEHNYNKLNYNGDYEFKNDECNRCLISDLKMLWII